jgi:hypothetical protein
MATIPLASKIDFYALTRPVQDRFAAATRGLVPPAPILFERAARTPVWVLLGGASAGLMVAFALLAAGWGDVRHPLVIHGPKMIALDVTLFATVLYCILRAAGIVSRLGALPWRAGVYVFPGCVVDACAATLEVWPMENVESVERLTLPAAGLAFRTSDGLRVVVRSPDAGQAELAAASIEAARRELARARANGDLQTMAEFDPLHDRAMSSPIGPTEPMKPSVPVWIRWDWAIAAVLGAVIGQGLAVVRNALSDASAYRAVTREGTVEAYTEYLARHGSHSDEVRDVLLPRVELRQAEGEGTVLAVRAFAQRHESSKIGPEIEASLRRAMLVELDRARTQGTVSALDAFARAYPDPVVDAELRAARHALFVRALAAWRARARPDAATDAFMARLTAWAEDKGPTCEVRFREKTSTSIADADKSVMRSPHYPGPDALPSKYITEDLLRQNEEAVDLSIVKQFADAFPADVLSVRASSPLAADEPAPGSIPALVIEFAPEWSRGTTTCPKPPTVFAGLSFQFNATFALPVGAPWTVTVKSWRVAESWKIKAQGLTLEEFEQKVYGSMLAGAFDQLRKKLSDVLF